MQFQFINNNSTLCHAAKRRIRTHAAKEKNLGRTVVRPSKKSVLSQRRVLPFRVAQPRSSSSPETSSSRGSSISPGTSPGTSLSPESDSEVTLAIGRQIGDGLSVLPFPVELSQEPRELVHRAIFLSRRVHYMSEMCNAFEADMGPPSMWFQLILEDEAYFHVFVAMSVVSFNSIPAKEDDPVLAVRHLNKTFLLTNRRLSSTDAVSDVSMAVVVMMAQYERQRERYINGLSHIDGLQRMVGIRGGITQLAKDKPSLFQKIIRLDLDYALYLGTATRFNIEDVAAGCANWSFQNSFGREYDPKPPNFGHLINLDAELQDLAIDMTYLAWLLNDARAGRRPALNTRAFHGILLMIGYRLIHFSPLSGSRSVSHLDNAVHLGLVAFMMPFMSRYDGSVPDNPLLSQLIRVAVQQCLSTDEKNQETLLWILLVGAASVFIQPLDEWILPLISQMMDNLRLHTWEDVSRAIAKYPWTDAYHNESGQALCESLMHRTPSPLLDADV